ncbi:oxygenase MpaB family protein [Nocardioides humilatus]|uniref:oxygenase MpaB family protein n=1 Tax=Nocardioides humilatus TaxID=2607660 RepID=UPI001CB6FE45|nr:oxygenase MpaB family protein [Nocardioides humilatus]
MTADSDIAEIRPYIDGIAALYAGGANVIMQLGWPEVGRGVFESKVESGRTDLHPIKRARTTFTYLSVALLGSDDERAAYRREVNRQHAQVRSAGGSEESPVAYNAMNPELQLWVAACLYWGTEDIVQRLHGPLDEATLDLLYRHGSRLGTTLQVREDMWPADRAAFEVYWAEGLRRVSYDADVRRYLLKVVLGVNAFPWPLRVTFARFIRFMNIGSLPPYFREALDVPWTAADQRRHDRVFRLTRLVSRVVPSILRRQPFGLLLLDLRLRRRFKRQLV